MQSTEHSKVSATDCLVMDLDLLWALQTQPHGSQLLVVETSRTPYIYHKVLTDLLNLEQ